MTAVNLEKRSVTILRALIIAGESIFFLPFVLARVFRPTLLTVFEVSNTGIGIWFSKYGIVAISLWTLGCGFLVWRLVPAGSTLARSRHPIVIFGEVLRHPGATGDHFVFLLLSLFALIGMVIPLLFKLSAGIRTFKEP